MKILLVGCGKMGEAMLSGWQKAKFSLKDIVVVEPNMPSLGEQFNEVTFHQDASQLGDFVPDVVFLAVKPQAMPQVAPLYKKFSRALFVSIAAGITLECLEGFLGADKAIARAMPNINAVNRKAVTVWVANNNVTRDQKAYVVKLFEAVGAEIPKRSDSIIRLESDQEELMHVVTAISGSGPAYVFYFWECFEKVAIELGLDEKKARYLVKGTMKGSIDSLTEITAPSVEEWRRRVTSPGGTTEAALRVLMDNTSGLEQLMREAVKAAARRSSELNEN